MSHDPQCKKLSDSVAMNITIQWTDIYSVLLKGNVATYNTARVLTIVKELWESCWKPVNLGTLGKCYVHTKGYTHCYSQSHAT